MKDNTQNEIARFVEIDEILPPEAPETALVRGKERDTDQCYTLTCPDVIISVKVMGKKTSIRIDSVEQVEGEDPIFLEARCNTIPTRKGMEQAIIKVKLAYDAIIKFEEDEGNDSPAVSS